VGQFTVEYVALPNGRIPVQEFLESVDEKASAKVLAFIDQLQIRGTQMPAKYVTKLTADLFELRVKHFDRIFRVLFFYQPGKLIVLTSGFQKMTQQTPSAEITRADRLRMLWLKYRNHYPESEAARQAILKETGL
jgi:phage-related protein